MVMFHSCFNCQKFRFQILVQVHPLKGTLWSGYVLFSLRCDLLVHFLLGFHFCFTVYLTCNLCTSCPLWNEMGTQKPTAATHVQIARFQVPDLKWACENPHTHHSHTGWRPESYTDGTNLGNSYLTLGHPRFWEISGKVANYLGCNFR